MPNFINLGHRSTPVGSSDGNSFVHQRRPFIITPSLSPRTSTPWLVYCDGSALPNPGRMGLGAVWTAPDGTRHTLSQMAPGEGCNNEAEVRALIAVLLALQPQGANDLRVHCDNSLVVKQVGSHTAKPVARLAALFDEARALFNTFDQALLVWIPQHRNVEADTLARAALGITAPRKVKISKKRH